jgi:hypothetical protein
MVPQVSWRFLTLPTIRIRPENGDGVAAQVPDSTGKIAAATPRPVLDERIARARLPAASGGSNRGMPVRYLTMRYKSIQSQEQNGSKG